jgi:hypothetical protein
MQTLGRLPMQSSVGHDLLSERTDSLPLCLSFPSFLFMVGDDVQPPSTTSITASSGSERPKSNLHLGDVAASAFYHLELSWIPARRVWPVNLDETLTGRTMVPKM